MLAAINAFNDITGAGAYQPPVNTASAAYVPAPPPGWANSFVFPNGTAIDGNHVPLAGIPVQCTAYHPALAADPAAGHPVSVEMCHRAIGMAVFKSVFHRITRAPGNSYSATKVTVLGGGAAPTPHANQPNFAPVLAVWQRVLSRCACGVFLSALNHHSDGTPWSDSSEDSAERLARQLACFGMPDMEATLAFIMEHWPAGANLGRLSTAITGDNAKAWCIANDCAVVGLKLPAKVRGTGDGENCRALYERAQRIPWAVTMIAPIVGGGPSIAARVTNYQNARAAHNATVALGDGNIAAAPAHPWANVLATTLVGARAQPATVAASREVLIEVSRECRNALMALASIELQASGKTWDNFKRYARKQSHLRSYALTRCFETSRPYCNRCLAIANHVQGVAAGDTLALLKASM